MVELEIGKVIETFDKLLLNGKITQHQYDMAINEIIRDQQEKESLR